jgi:acetylornithine deacetylase/succinyl-diaminopimelate desuccinylase-like protein
MKTKNTVINKNSAISFSNRFWNEVAIPGLSEFIKIPCKSLTFDADWKRSGHVMAAANLLADWAKAQNLPGFKSEIVQLKNCTPLLYIEIIGSAGSDNTTLFYGHLDKMPESEGWEKGLSPWNPVIRDNKLYGRGSVDNGYALFTLVAALKILENQNIPYGRIVILIESGEESGSPHFPAYLQHLHERIGNPKLILCLDAGCHSYDRLWCTNSLRGIIEGTLKVSILRENVHSGSASGIIPSSFRIMRQLLNRIEDEDTGEILLKSCNVKIPGEYKKQAKALAQFFGKSFYEAFPLMPNMQPVTDEIDELILNRNWRPTLSVIGAEGLPTVQNAGSVIRPYTSLQLSLRIPPLCKVAEVEKEFKEVLEKDPPYGAEVSFLSPGGNAVGWCAPVMSKSLQEAIDMSSLEYFGNEPLYSGEGGSIGVIPLMQEFFPQAQYLVTGLLSGPGANEHGPNESLDISAAKKFTCCMAKILKSYDNVVE